jgi:lysozyme family protein
MDIDGIGGIVIGNLFKINNSILPAGYKGLSGFGRQLGFIVKNFHHKIENNDWVTTIEAYPFLIPEVQDIADPSNVVSYWNKFFEIAKVLAPTRGSTIKPTLNDYNADFDSVTKINPEANVVAKQIITNKSKYDPIAAATNIPWWVIGIIHYRESTFDFKKHLHNGDPLTDRTKNKPPNRPNFNPKRGTEKPSASNPYSFTESAIDALSNKPAIMKADYTSIPSTLSALEAYNGLGYAQLGAKSPYIWSGTELYSRGKYKKDEVIDYNLIDKQMGAAAIIKGLQAQNVKIP